ncbi:Hypothetical predicted protein, partial [Olea europaea subsp. europaea]
MAAHGPRLAGMIDRRGDQNAPARESEFGPRARLGRLVASLDRGQHSRSVQCVPGPASRGRAAIIFAIDSRGLFPLFSCMQAARRRRLDLPRLARVSSRMQTR